MVLEISCLAAIGAAWAIAAYAITSDQPPEHYDHPAARAAPATRGRGPAHRTTR